ncbi:hypothetical protein ACHAXS_008881 [Conticribra weissflogii]
MSTIPSSGQSPTRNTQRFHHLDPIPTLIDNRIPNPNIRQVLNAALHHPTGMLTQIVHVPIGQHVVKQDGFARLGLDFDSIVELSGDGAGEGGFSSLERRAFRVGGRRRRRRNRRLWTDPQQIVVFLVDDVPLSRQIHQHRGKSPGLISILHGRIGEIVMRLVPFAGPVPQQLHRFDDSIVRRQSLVVVVMVFVVDVMSVGPPPTFRPPIPHQPFVHPEHVGHPPENGIDHRVLLSVDPPPGGRAHLRQDRSSDARSSRGGDGGSFRGRNDGVGSGGEAEEDPGGDAEDSEGEAVKVVVVGLRVGGGVVRVGTNAGAKSSQFRATSGDDVGTVVVAGEDGKGVRQGGERGLRGGRDVGLAEVVGAPQGHSRLVRATLPIPTPFRADVAQKRVVGRIGQREMGQPRCPRLDQVIPRERPVDRPGVSVKGHRRVPRPVLRPAVPSFPFRLLGREVLQRVVKQDRVVLRDRPPLQYVLGVVDGGDAEGVPREGGRAEGVHGGDGSHEGGGGRGVGVGAAGVVPIKADGAGREVDEFGGEAGEGERGGGELAVGGGATAAARRRRRRRRTKGVVVVAFVACEWQPRVFEVGRDVRAVVDFGGAAEGAVGGSVLGVLAEQAEMLSIDEGGGEVSLHDRSEFDLESERKRFGGVRVGGHVRLEEPVDVLQNGVVAVRPQTPLRRAALAVEAAAGIAPVGIRRGRIERQGVAQVVRVEDLDGRMQREEELHIDQAVDVTLVLVAVAAIVATAKIQTGRPSKPPRPLVADRRRDVPPARCLGQNNATAIFRGNAVHGRRRRRRRVGRTRVGRRRREVVGGGSARNAAQVARRARAAPERVPVPDHGVFPGRDPPVELGVRQNGEGDGEDRGGDVLGEFATGGVAVTVAVGGGVAGATSSFAIVVGGGSGTARLLVVGSVVVVILTVVVGPRRVGSFLVGVMVVAVVAAVVVVTVGVFVIVSTIVVVVVVVVSKTSLPGHRG